MKYDIDTIKKRLNQSGVEEENLNKVMDDVMQIVILRTVNNYFSELPPEERSKIERLSQDNLVDYIKLNKNKLPSFSVKNFETIFQETWEEYFKNLEK